MKSSFLRRFRIFFSALLFLSFFAVFTDFRALIPTKFVTWITSTQFIPSILKYIHTGTLISAGFIIILFLTLLTGRTYCSFLCPLGIGQDIMSRTGGLVSRKFRRYGYRKPFTVIRYTLLALTVLISLRWGIHLLSLLDPFSIFGRFMTIFGKPVLVELNNLMAGLLGKFDLYSLSNIPEKGFALPAYIIPTGFLLLTGILSFTKGRLYCNTICPVGTLLGLISKISVFRVRFNKDACKMCGRCALRCKSSCIDFIHQKIDVSRCVDCFNCIDDCQENALSYSLTKLPEKKHFTDEKRRAVIAGTAMFLLGMESLAKGQSKQTPQPKQASTVKEKRNYPVFPPGGGSITAFTKDCTACSLCISACPNEVLKPSVNQYGLAGIMQPVMDYHKSFCTYNCNRCTEVCPTYALQPLSVEAKKLTQLGKANFIKDNCIVKTEKTACGACSEACPTKAVYMIPYEGNLLIPEVNNEICIGCGHCEYVCPTAPYKAIFVDGNPVHLVAKKPEIKSPDKKAPSEFPF